MMRTNTEIALKAIMQMDPATANKVGPVMKILNAPDYVPKLISESSAAEILGLSNVTLNQWRRKGRDGRKFPFSVMEECGRVLYDEHEIILHIQAKTKKGEME